MTSVRVVISLAASLGWKLWQFDVKMLSYMVKLKRTFTWTSHLGESLHMIVLLYVDDMIITGNDEGEVAKLRAELSIRFEMKDLGELNHFLGLEVEKVNDGIFLSQKGYAKKLIERFGINSSKLCSTPLDANIKIRRKEEPRKPHLDAVKQILKYVNTTCDMGILYNKGTVFLYLGLDADFGGDLDDRRSTGMCSFVAQDVFHGAAKARFNFSFYYGSGV
ncbi:uncharacterized mitochondrial protein AtMg00810-like [Telopea speciosissima]|uniref:uncharacterized mitochondrial protein AtMg00810-like n=1 Tax=Telopea speciosissima TaxID=54955 RepID=UPI001CC5DEF4|nr:uncharacterized mitochondrial protein AtMg00810-like [Telopea speciosissima]